MCHQKLSSPTLRYQFSGNWYMSLMSHNATHMILKDVLAVKPHTEDIKIWTSPYANTRQDQFTMFRVNSPRSTHN